MRVFLLGRGFMNSGASATRRRRLWSLRLVPAAMALVGCLLVGVSAASANPLTPAPAYSQGHAYRHGVVPMHGHQVNASTFATSASDMSFRGGISGVGVTTGPPRVYVVFWGSQWGAQGTSSSGDVTFANDPKQYAPYLQDFI